MDRIDVGSVHGRFQPFHNGHLDYLLQAFDAAAYVKVGLTQIFWPDDQAASRARDTVDSNPLAYWERASLVEAALDEAGIASGRFEFVPFPIEIPDALPQFMPIGVPCFTTVLNMWNEEKIDVLKQQGYSTILLEVSPAEGKRVATGAEIRRLIREGNGTWKAFVPPVVAQQISEKFMHRFE